MIERYTLECFDRNDMSCMQAGFETLDDMNAMVAACLTLGWTCQMTNAATHETQVSFPDGRHATALLFRLQAA